MKVINHTEFEVGEAPILRARAGVVAFAKAGIAKLSGLFRKSYQIDRLPARLLRDAGIDDLEIERRRLANAPLIR